MARRQSDIALPFPYGGISEISSFEDQPRNTTPKAENVRPFSWVGTEADRGRMGGGQRSGIKNFHTGGNFVRAHVSDGTRTCGPSVQDITHISTTNVEELVGTSVITTRSNDSEDILAASGSLGDLGASDSKFGGTETGQKILGSAFDTDENLYVVRKTTASPEVLSVQKWVFADTDADFSRDEWQLEATSGTLSTSGADDWWLNGLVVYGGYLYLWVMRTDNGTPYDEHTTTAKTEQLLRVPLSTFAASVPIEEWLDNSTDGITTATTVGKRGWATNGLQGLNNCLAAGRGRLAMLMGFGPPGHGSVAYQRGVTVIQRDIETGEVTAVGEATSLSASVVSEGGNGSILSGICADSAGNFWAVGQEGYLHTDADKPRVLYRYTRDDGDARVVMARSMGSGPRPKGITYDPEHDRILVVGGETVADYNDDERMFFKNEAVSRANDWIINGVDQNGVADRPDDMKRSSFQAFHASDSITYFSQINVDDSGNKIKGFDPALFDLCSGNLVSLSSSGDLPTGYTARDYYVTGVAADSTTGLYEFQLSLTKGGSAVSISDKGSSDGSHKLVRLAGEICRVRLQDAPASGAGTISEIVVLNGGGGYDEPEVAVTNTYVGGEADGVFTGTSLTIDSISRGAGDTITAITVDNAGSGYKDAPKLVISEGGSGGSGAEAIAIVIPGEGYPISFFPRGFTDLEYVAMKANGGCFVAEPETLPASTNSVPRLETASALQPSNIAEAKASSGGGSTNVQTRASAAEGGAFRRMGVDAVYALDQGHTQPNRQTVTVAVAGGTVRRVGPRRMPRVEGGDYALASDTPVIFSVPYGVGDALIFFADGVTNKYYDHRVTSAGVRGSIKSWDAGIYNDTEIGQQGLYNVRAGQSKGEFPVDKGGGKPRLIEKYNRRVVLSGLPAEPNNWYMTRVGDPFDFNYSVAPVGAEQAANRSLDDKINAMVPFADDVLVFGCDHSIIQLSGDPMYGGQYDTLSDTIGMAWGRPWCKAPHGAAFFFGSRGGVYTLAPNSRPQDITSRAIRERMAKIDLSAHIIRMVWNDREVGFHVLISPIDPTSATEHFYFDLRTESWWIDKFEARWGSDPASTGGNFEENIYPHNAVAIHTFDGDAVGDRVMLLGGRDGRIYKWDVTAQSDYLGTVPFPIKSNVYYGPLNFRNSGKVSLSALNGTLSGTRTGEPNPRVDYDVLVGNTAEEIVNSADESKIRRFSGTWSPGRNNTNRDRAIAHDIMIKIKSNDVSTTLTGAHGTGTTLTVGSTTGILEGDKLAITDATNPVSKREVVTVASNPSTATGITLVSPGLSRTYVDESTAVLVDNDWALERVGVTLGSTGRRTSRTHQIGRKA
jgi:hypothetical protein